VQFHKSPGAAKEKALPRLAKFHSMAKIFRKKTSNPGAKYSKVVYVTVQWNMSFGQITSKVQL
jgi:hypothetical protein